ncbi:MAG: cobyric acid synthase, partial [Chloroflexota bacterium]
VDMNPILLKPEHGGQSQVVVLGRATSRVSGRAYFETREQLWPVVCQSLDRLRSMHDLVIIEGAGSPVEVNLRQWDIVNMRVARYADAPVLVVADIDRGGALAALVGTMELLEPAERALVRGLLINRFRGDLSLFQPALTFLLERTGVPVLGVVPHLDQLRLPSEDSASLETYQATSGTVDVAAIRLPQISNFDDLDPLLEIGARVRWIKDSLDLGKPSMVVIPGSKSTRADLEFLWSSGLAAAIRAAATRGALVLGICGGYQMLGSELIDPGGIEGAPGETPGLGLLQSRTTFLPEKVTRQVHGRIVASAGPLSGIHGSAVDGYEIHDGVTSDTNSPLLRLEDGDGGRLDGAHSHSGRVMGTYLHGLLHNATVLEALSLALCVPINRIAHVDIVDQELDRLADVLQDHSEIRLIDALVGLT